jgi:membrane-associated protease RseP (regulator of RpoE activity)
MPKARTSLWATALALASVLGYIVLSYRSMFGPYGPGLGVEDSAGSVVINEVDPGGAAEAAGIAVNDRLMAVNGQRLSNVVDWLALRMNFVPGQPVALHIQRNAQPLDTTFTIRETVWSTLSRTAQLTEIIFLLSKLITLIVGLFIVLNRPRDFVGRLGGWLVPCIHGHGL